MRFTEAWEIILQYHHHQYHPHNYHHMQLNKRIKAMEAKVEGLPQQLEVLALNLTLNLTLPSP